MSGVDGGDAWLGAVAGSDTTEADFDQWRSLQADVPGPAPRCTSFAGGHLVHGIQARKALTGSFLPAEILAVEGNHLKVHVPGRTRSELTMWNHHAALVALALERLGGPLEARLHAFGVLAVGPLVLNVLDVRVSQPQPTECAPANPASSSGPESPSHPRARQRVGEGSS